MSLVISQDVFGKENFFSKNEKQNLPGVSKVLTPGMSSKEYQKVIEIKWKKWPENKAKWTPVEVDLGCQLHYNDFKPLIKKLSVSGSVVAYTASVKTADKREFYTMEIGTGAKVIVFSGGVHSREAGNPQFLFKLASVLVNGYEAGDQAIKELLSTHKIVIFPCVNPDGYAAATEGGAAIRNKDLFLAKRTGQEIFSAKCNARGVDINRNFPSYTAALVWDNEIEHTSGRDKHPSLYYFCGDKLGSEAETKVAMNFLLKYIPLACRFVDVHSAGRVIYSGKPHLSDEFNDLSIQVGKLIADVTHYEAYGLEEEDTANGVDGTMSDFAAEIASGFIFNENLGRLAPEGAQSVVRKTINLPFKCSSNTLETLYTTEEKGYGLTETSTPDMHNREWTEANLLQMFMALITL